jgi:hypothetical protein
VEVGWHNFFGIWRNAVNLKSQKICGLAVFFMPARQEEHIMRDNVKRKHYTTKEFADLFGRESNTVRHSLCRKGHYMGVKPVKLPTGGLLWPREAIDRLLDSDGKK